MKLKLALAFALLLAASVARADSVSTTYGPVYIPDGSVVTSIVYSDIDWLQATVSFSFSDGIGVVENQQMFGMVGWIDFTTPVSNLSFNWYGPNFDDLGYDAPDSGTMSFAGPLSYLGWASDNYGSGSGIDSMTYMLDATDPPASVPEPPTVAMLLLGLAAIGLAFMLYLFVRVVIEYRHDTRIAKDREEHGW
jgi:PEP-CTERM motif